MNSSQDSTVQRDQGFTLVEMLVVLAIMALTVAISLPYAARSNDARNLRAATELLAARLRQAQMRAVLSNEEFTLSIDLDKASIIDDGSHSITPLPPGISIKITTAENEIIQERASFRFFPDGGATGGEIVLGSGQNIEKIAINWLTGAIVVIKASAP
jgi:general secretion pathway protein H